MDMVIIGLDMKNSTEYLMEHGVEKTMALHNIFHTTMVELIREEYYPYMYIHEIMGDGFVIILNLEWAYHFPRFCASMAYAFIVKLYEKTKITFRTGISYGKLHYGYIDNHLRFFGEHMNRASRYESVCRDKMIATDSYFYQKLCDEDMFQPVIEEEEIMLKGIGMQDMIHLHYDYHAINRMEELAIRSVENSPENRGRSIAGRMEI
jgi:class 3 adenylate cyclase